MTWSAFSQLELPKAARLFLKRKHLWKEPGSIPSQKNNDDVAFSDLAKVKKELKANDN